MRKAQLRAQNNHSPPDVQRYKQTLSAYKKEGRGSRSVRSQNQRARGGDREAQSQTSEFLDNHRQVDGRLPIVKLGASRKAKGDSRGNYNKELVTSCSNSHGSTGRAGTRMHGSLSQRWAEFCTRPPATTAKPRGPCRPRKVPTRQSEPPPASSEQGRARPHSGTATGQGERTRTFMDQI